MSTVPPTSVVNPKTGRCVLVGGKIWRRLLHDKVIEGDIIVPANELYQAETVEEAKIAKKMIAKKNPPKPGYGLKRDSSGKRVISCRKPLTQKQLEEYAKMHNEGNARGE